MARKAKYDWGKSRDGRYQKFETRISTKLVATNSNSPYADSGYIDIAQCLSMINRKLVRQGQVFKVKGMKIYSKDESPVTTGKIGVLPRTWVMFNAYKKARSLWLQQAQQAFMNVGEGNLPKYLDFKVLMDEGHYTNKAAGTDLLLPMDFDENLATDTDCDWDYSRLNDNQSTSDAFFLHVLGRHHDQTDGFTASLDENHALNSAGLIMGYQQSRGSTHTDVDASDLSQQSANIMIRGPFGRLNLRGDDQMLETITQHADENDSPPYDYNEYPGGGGELKEATTVWTGRIPQKTMGTLATVPTFEAPLGLIRVEVDGPTAIDAETIEIHFDTEIIGPV